MNFNLSVYEGRQLDLASPRPFGKWIEKHLNVDPTGSVTAMKNCYHGHFMATRASLHRRPQADYANVETQLRVPEPEAGHYMERAVSLLYGSLHLDGSNPTWLF